MFSLTMALMTLAITFASSMFNLASIVTAEGLRRGTRAHCTRYESVCAGRPVHLNSSQRHTEAAHGFAFDPIVWGPTSELSGRHIALLVGVFGMSCFQIGVAVAPNLYTRMICDFLAGLFYDSVGIFRSGFTPSASPVLQVRLEHQEAEQVHSRCWQLTG